MSYCIIAREESITFGNSNIKYEHNERINKTYMNQDIDLSKDNYYYKKPDKSYTAAFHEMAERGLFSTRKIRQGDKSTAFGSEIIVSVAGSYLSSPEQAIEFYKVANEALNDFFTVRLPDGRIIKGEDLCISSVLHLDEASPGLHYCVCPCVGREKFKRRTKKQMQTGIKPVSEGWYCQLSHSGFWKSEKDENGKLYYSYSKLNDIVAKAYSEAGYDDIQRGKKGSTQKHLHPNVYKELMNEIRANVPSKSELPNIKKLAGKYILDEDSFKRISLMQNNIEKQNYIINKTQEIVDKEKENLMEEKRKVKKKELEAANIIRENAKVTQKYQQAVSDLNEKEQIIQNMKTQVQESQEESDFCERLYLYIVDILRKIIDWLRSFLHDELKAVEQKRIRENIEGIYNELINVAQTINVEVCEER